MTSQITWLLHTFSMLPLCFEGRPGADPYGFHRFAEISQSFHNKCIFNIKTLQVEIERWNNRPICNALSEENGIGQNPVWMIQKSGKFPVGAYLRTFLEPCAFGSRSGNRSEFILDRLLTSNVFKILLKYAQLNFHCYLIPQYRVSASA